MFVLNLLLFLVALSILVFVHELGHFLFAKLFGVYCHEFSIGMGPAIVKKKFKKDKETTYSLRWLPIGGYVMMAGETDASEKDKEVPYNRTINGIKAWQRAIIVVAGAVINFIFGLVLIFVVVFSGGVKNYVKESRIYIEENSVAYDQGLRSNDLITYIVIEGGSGEHCALGCQISTSEELFTYMSKNIPTKENNLQTITITYSRNEVENTVSIQRSYIEETDSVSLVGISMMPIPLTFFGGIKFSFELFFKIIKAMFQAIGMLFTKEGFSQVGGPVAIYQVSASQAKEGFIPYLWFMALLSVNLGFFNLLPFPGLDGARFYTSIYEMITRKKVNPKIESYVNAVGLILLIGLMLVVTVKDIIGLFR